MTRGDLDGAIELSRSVVDHLIDEGGAFWVPVVTAVLVKALVQRGAAGDLEDAQIAIDRLAAVPMEPGFVLNEIWQLRMRALLARSRGDEVAYRDFVDRYRDMAASLGFEGHMKWAEAMP